MGGKLIVYRDKPAKAYLEHSFNKPLTATVYRANNAVGSINRPVTSVNGIHSVDITYEDTQYDGEIYIYWSGENFERKTNVTVVSPIVPFNRLKTLFPDRDGDEEFFFELESSVRLIIESFTGTKFEYFKGIIKVPASGSALMLPVRAIDVYQIPGLPSFRVSPNGRVVIGMNEQYLGIKEAPPEEFSFTTHGVITVPSWYRRIQTGNIYDVYGEFGYLNIPEDVQEAALLLANDFACNDGIYRDKYIQTAKTELTNYVFANQAFTGTGNARVDSLLSKYKVDGYAWL